MSQENVAVVRRGYESWLTNRSFDFDLLDPDVEWKTAALLDGGVLLRGHEGVRDWFRQMGNVWEDMWWEIEELHDLGDRILAITRAFARGRGSGVVVETVIGTVWTVGAGKVVRVETHMDPAEARRAVGLQDQAMSEDNVQTALAAERAVAEMDLARLLDVTDPDVEWHSFLADLGDGGVYRGHDGMRQYVLDLREAWEVFDAEVDDIHVDGDVVLLMGRLRYRGKGSGVDATSPAAHLVRFRAGRIVHRRSFRDRDKALEAVGLQG